MEICSNVLALLRKIFLKIKKLPDFSLIAFSLFQYQFFIQYSLFCHIFHTEAESSHFIFSKAYDFHNIAKAYNILNLFNSVLGKL